MPPPDDSQIPELPVPHEPSGWEHFELWTGVRRALYAVPAHFRSEVHIECMLATDIFTLSSPLGATIEEAAVNSLNGLRHVWDPDCRHQPLSGPSHDGPVAAVPYGNLSPSFADSLRV